MTISHLDIRLLRFILNRGIVSQQDLQQMPGWQRCIPRLVKAGLVEWTGRLYAATTKGEKCLVNA